MTDSNEPQPATPAGRTPGKYLVIGFVGFFVIFLIASIYLARTLEPAADRFHNPPPASKKG